MTWLFRVLMSFHRDFILVKVSSSSWCMSPAAQQQPRWRLKVQLQSHLSQVRGSFHLTGGGGVGTVRESGRKTLPTWWFLPLTSGVLQNGDGAGLGLRAAAKEERLQQE